MHIAILLFVGLVLRLAMAPFGTLDLDVNTFVAWSNNLAQTQNGFSQFYQSWSDYLPGYLYVLWFLAKVKEIFPIPEILLYKLPAILADVAMGFLVFRVVSRFNKKWALSATAIYLFNPAVLANSTLWGQIEGITAFFALTSVFFASTNPVTSSFMLGVGALIKPQAGFIAGLVLLLWFKKFGFNNALLYSVIALIIFALGFVPFAGDRQLFSFIFERLSATASQYPYTSINAFNFWAIVHGLWQPDNGLYIVGLALVGLLVTLVFWKRFAQLVQNRFLVAAWIMAVAFFFLTRMHERHLLPALAPLVIASFASPLLLIPYALFSLTYIVNLWYSYVWISQDFRTLFPQEIIVLFSVINMMALGIIGLVIFAPKLGKIFLFNRLKRIYQYLTAVSRHPVFSRQYPVDSIRQAIPDKFVRPLLVGIITFALVSRIWGLWFPDTFYFDEVYHAFTAREMLGGNPAAWEWWDTPPAGFAYEWTHPPLAKLLMAGGMWLLGEQPIGWRLLGAGLGTGTVLLVYLLAFQLFKNPKGVLSGQTIGILSAGVFALDGLPLVLSRIGMNDTYFLFFVLLAILLFLTERYLFSSVALGFAGASKWTTLWAIPIFLVIMVLFGKKPRFRIFWFAIVPPLIYLLSYIPFFTSGHTLDQFIELQKQMWWYHTSLHATHAFGSAWWTWPLMIRPVWLFTQAKDGLIANIYAMGNPLVFWLGLTAIILAIWHALRFRNGTLLFVVLSWGFLFLPWALSPRIMFLYHYLPAVPFLSIALGWWLSLESKKIVITTFGFLLFAFCYFYPHWSGMFVPQWLDNLYYFLPSWKW